ncbi:MAG: hypothetical protein WAX07_02735 [Candidatus Altiarchaeia archaeon]
MAAKNMRCGKGSHDPLELRLCRFEKMTAELEIRISSFGKKKRSKYSKSVK